MAAACLAAAALASVASADAGSADTDSYSLAASPSQVAGDSTTTFAITITNPASNAEPISGAIVTAPSSLRLLKGSLPAGSKGSVTVRGHAATLHNLAIAPGRPLKLDLEARAAVRCGRVTGTWRSTAWEDDPGFPQGRESLAVTGRPVRLAVVSPCLRRYALVVSPATVQGGATGHVRVALYNRSSPGINLSSANVSAPPGFKVTGASLAYGGSGDVKVVGGAVQVRFARVRPGGALVLSLTATAPAQCGSLSESWKAAVRQDPGFTADPLTLVASASASRITVVTSCALKFATQPHAALIGEHITGSDYETAATPVTVQVVDDSGDVVSSASGQLTLTLNEPSGAGATLAGASAQVSDGQATFPGLEVNNPDNGYSLTASHDGWAPVTSSSFNVSNQGKPCPQNQTCSTLATAASGNSSPLSASPQSGQNAGVLEESINIRTTHPLDCSNPARGGYTSLSPDTFAFKMNPSTHRTEVWTMKLVRPLPPIDQQTIDALLAAPQVCYGSQTAFTAATGAPAPPGVLPDGSAGFIGTLPNCVSPGGFGPTGGACIDQSNVQRPVDLSNGLGFDVIVPVDVPLAQGDPMRH
jgi:hypothetical protein